MPTKTKTNSVKLGDVELMTLKLAQDRATTKLNQIEAQKAAVNNEFHSTVRQLATAIGVVEGVEVRLNRDAKTKKPLAIEWETPIAKPKPKPRAKPKANGKSQRQERLSKAKATPAKRKPAAKKPAKKKA